MWTHTTPCFSVHFGAQLSIVNDLILEKILLIKVREPNHLQPPKEILWFEVFMHEILYGQNFLKLLEECTLVEWEENVLWSDFWGSIVHSKVTYFEYFSLIILSQSSKLAHPKRILWFEVFMYEIFNEQNLLKLWECTWVEWEENVLWSDFWGSIVHSKVTHFEYCKTNNTCTIK